MLTRHNDVAVMSDDNTKLKNYLANHPKMLGVLFTALMLLTQAGSAIAGNGGVGTAGP